MLWYLSVEDHKDGLETLQQLSNLSFEYFKYDGERFLKM